MTVALIALPLVCAVLIGFLPLDRRVAAALGLAAVLAELVLAAVAIVTFNVGGGTQFVTDRVWIPNLIGGADVHFHVAMDGLSMFMVALTAVGVASAVWTAIHGRPRPPRPVPRPACSCSRHRW